MGIEGGRSRAPSGRSLLLLLSALSGIRLAQQRSRAAKSSSSAAEAAQGLPLWMVGGILGALAASICTSGLLLGTEAAGAMLFAVVSAFTLGGFHIVFTQVWLLLTAALLMMGSEGGVCVMAACGWNVAFMWYGANIIRASDRAPQRAMHGWARWILENLCGDLCAYPVPNWDKGGHAHLWKSYVSVNGSYALGFLMFDLALHLLPALALLQVAAASMQLHHVAIAYAGARVVSLAVTAHHWEFDWAHLGAFRRLRITRASQPVTAWVDGGVVARIYGMEPPPERSFFTAALALEAAASAALGGLCLLPQPLKEAALRALCLADLASVFDLMAAAAACITFGFMLTVGGVALARRLYMPKSLRDPPGGWARAGRTGPWGPAETVSCGSH